LRKIPSGDFEKFLRLVDEELAEPFTIIVVGGAAIGMAYAPDHSTSDIDLMPLRSAPFWDAVERAQQRLAVRVPIQVVGIVQPPYEEIHRISPLSLATLVSRYEESRPQFIGHPANLKLSFLALVARLFGEEEARRVETEIR
jgi:hypothetical protein